MISIIISTYQPNFLKALEINIEKTIGVPYEIIAIENHNLKGICEVYNTGATRAKYNILCFCHEDILFNSQNWGKTVLEIFNNDFNLGLLGVAGSAYKSVIPAGWAIMPEARAVNLIQHYKYSTSPTHHHYENPKQESLTPVTCIDGVWMCTRKKIALELKFDEITFKNFHCYDIDFSLSVFNKYKVAVTFDILIEHFSEGRNDKNWIIENIKLHKKWKNILPINNIDKFSFTTLSKYETQAGLEFVYVMEKFQFPVFYILKISSMFLRSKYIIKSTFINGVSGILKSYFKRRLKTALSKI